MTLRTRLTVAAAAVLMPITAQAANPIMPGADPHLVVVGGQYWLYPTFNGGFAEKVFKAASSPDLKTWTQHDTILDFKDVPWVKADGRTNHGAWAPGVLAAGGKFYFYYSVGPQDPGKPSRIGVAVADAPQGPFKDSGKPLITGGNGFEAIDAMAFHDAKSDKTYLYAGGSNGAKLRAWELNPDLVSLKREVKIDTPKDFTEGTFVHERDGTYYLSYSHGGWNLPNYSVHYATGPSPTGPWTYKGPILTSDATHKGPGHHSFFVNPKTGETFICYHRWETTDDKGPFGGIVRQVAVDKVNYAADGSIETIKMTDGDAPVSPLK